MIGEKVGYIQSHKEREGVNYLNGHIRECAFLGICVFADGCLYFLNMYAYIASAAQHVCCLFSVSNRLYLWLVALMRNQWNTMPC